MRKLTKDDWSGHYPETNCMWMHYLADILLNKKGLAAGNGGSGSGAASKEELKQLSGFRRRATGYRTCNELIWDELFSGCWETREGGC